MLTVDICETEASEKILHCCLPNSLGLGLHKISHFLFACINKN